MLDRTLAQAIRHVSQNFPVLMVTGPRQVGKTTLLEMCSEGNRSYVTLDDMDMRRLAQQDPALFLQTWPAPVTIDEVQYAPQLFSAIKMAVDKDPRNGQFWLTGSQKFQLMQGLTESLAGRVAIVDLLGLSQAEQQGRAKQSQAFIPTPEWIAQARALAKPMTLKALYAQIWMGSYPRLQTQGEQSRDVFYRSYVQTYVQRDVRELLKVSDPLSFHRFLGVVAARTGQLLNYANLANELDIDTKTAKAWLSVLEASGLVYLLQPYHRNLTKRMLKSPKLYFLDTGLAAYLTKWSTPEALEAGSMSGAILETWAVAEILKSYWHNGKEAPLYFYRDTDQKEIDLLIESDDVIYPIEIKKTGTPSTQASKAFAAAAHLGKTVGPGAVLCLTPRDVPLSDSVTAIPMGYL
ncbi:ATP-binding protein [Limnohabitans parvus]|uniref:ATPase n=1 Tax=Limnohabitans parvus II-B4 TaxID=1293052 RepID=A0A315E2B6_9BURK|nr:ATP-binding protein [Limnohabitans parvus]PUE51966.1 ATPase [Limnohabitans parvus II-B4]